jgi:NAD(P)-dependent dehydrogenase (short-subunit alcohol dehydrogenase family)
MQQIAESSGRIALVTGANKGIGRETARRLAALGMTVLVGARDRERGESSVASLRVAVPSARIELLQLDVANDDSVAAASRDVAGRFGRLDVLVNNAGIALDGGPPSKQSLAAMRTMFGTNFFGTVAVTQAFLPLLLGSPAGRIVNVTSSLGSLGLASNPETNVAKQLAYFGYSATKTALNQLTVRLASELGAGSTLKINSACPGYVATDLNRHSGPRTVEQGAEIIVKLSILGPDGPSGGVYDDAGPVPW